MCQEHARDGERHSHTPNTQAGDTTAGARALRCPHCGLQFRIDRDGPLDQLVAAVGQHASGSHDHGVSRDTVLARLTPA